MEKNPAFVRRVQSNVDPDDYEALSYTYALLQKYSRHLYPVAREGRLYLNINDCSYVTEFRLINEMIPFYTIGVGDLEEKIGKEFVAPGFKYNFLSSHDIASIETTLFRSEYEGTILSIPVYINNTYFTSK